MLPHWTEGKVNVNGSELHYVRTGAGEKPALVLAHGFSDHGLCWLPVARDLEAHYDLILPDARGHGHSGRVQPGDEIDLAADLAGVIHALALSRPIVGGHSMGADTTAQMEARFSGLARALVLEDPPWFDPQPPKEPPAPRPAMADWIVNLKKLSEADMIAKCRADSPTWPEVELQPWAESKRLFDLNFTQGFRRPQPFWTEVVAALHAPTLLITADPGKGSIVTPQAAQAAAALNPVVRVVNIAGAGHSIRRENFSDYMAALQEFLLSV